MLNNEHAYFSINKFCSPFLMIFSASQLQKSLSKTVIMPSPYKNQFPLLFLSPLSNSSPSTFTIFSSSLTSVSHCTPLSLCFIHCLLHSMPSLHFIFQLTHSLLSLSIFSSISILLNPITRIANKHSKNEITNPFLEHSIAKLRNRITSQVPLISTHSPTLIFVQLPKVTKVNLID